MVEGLVLININSCAEGWMDWAAHKVMHVYEHLQLFKPFPKTVVTLTFGFAEPLKLKIAFSVF